jgi:hypothetical protein
MPPEVTLAHSKQHISDMINEQDSCTYFEKTQSMHVNDLNNASKHQKL